MTQKKDGLSELTGETERFDMTIDTEAIARAESIVAALGSEYLEWLKGDLDGVDDLLSKARESVRAVNDLRRKAHDIRGQGGSFGFPMISDLADALHRVSEAQEGFLDAEGEAIGRELLALMRRLAEEQGNENPTLAAEVQRLTERIRLEYGDT